MYGMDGRRLRPIFFRETEMLNFACDYLDGAHPKVFEALKACNYLKTVWETP